MSRPERPAGGIKVFFSYAHEDEELRDKLARHLSILKRQGFITEWHDREITAGIEWDRAIKQHLNSADIILLLISDDFLASDYCYSTEVKRAIEWHKAGDARVIPIILRDVDWEGAPFGCLNALPKNAKPVTSWPNSDEAFADVARGVRRTVIELLYDQGLHYMQAGQWSQAEQRFVKLLQLQPSGYRDAAERLVEVQHELAEQEQKAAQRRRRNSTYTVVAGIGILLVLIVTMVRPNGRSATLPTPTNLPTQAATVESGPAQVDGRDAAPFSTSEEQQALPESGGGLFDRFFVVVAEDGVTLRRQPKQTADEITVLPTGTELFVIDKPEVGDGLRWWPILGPAGEGWVAEWIPDPQDSQRGYRLIKPRIKPYAEVLVANPVGEGKIRLRKHGCNNPAGLDLSRGEVLTIIRGPERGCDVDDPHLVTEGREWWYVRTSSGEEGWVAEFSGTAKAILIAPDWYVELIRQSRSSD